MLLVPDFTRDFVWHLRFPYSRKEWHFLDFPYILQFTPPYSVLLQICSLFLAFDANGSISTPALSFGSFLLGSC